VADKPDGIVLSRHRDLNGREWHPWVRRGLVALLAVVILLALFGFVGQHPSTIRAEASAATLGVNSPDSVRGGLLYQARFTIDAQQDLKDATLVLSREWIDGLTVNTIEPSPLNEASDNGDLVLELGHIAAGARYVLYMDYQVNPTTVGSRKLRVALKDGDQPVASLTRDQRIWP
jgi:hypothetical protein